MKPIKCKIRLYGSYYKKYIPEVVEHFVQKFNLK